MNTFDKACAVLAFPLGIVFLILGGLGLITGCSANFTLPPVVGGIPALLGWGIIRSVIVAWRQPRGRSPVGGAQEQASIAPIVPRLPNQVPYDPPQS